MPYYIYSNVQDKNEIDTFLTLRTSDRHAACGSIDNDTERGSQGRKRKKSLKVNLEPFKSWL